MRSHPSWRNTLHEVIFEADTPAGKAFDIALLITIVASVVIVMLDSVEDLNRRYGSVFNVLEWLFTVLFTIEYVLRLIAFRRPMHYAVSFFGIVDLLAILPTYLELLLPGNGPHAIAIRTLRLLRIFRVFKLTRFLSEAEALRCSIVAARAKVAVFLTTVLIVVVIMGAAMHLVEFPRNPQQFSSIPQSMYWAIVTMTTVGFGDATPVTILGKILTAILIIIGYSLIIVPTGIVTGELVQRRSRSITTQVCPHCAAEGHDADAIYCKRCGQRLND